MPLSNRHQIPIRIVLIHSISNKCHEMYKKCIIEVFRDLLGNILQPRRSTWNIAHTNSLSTSPWRLIFKGISCYMNPVQLKFLKKPFFSIKREFCVLYSVCERNFTKCTCTTRQEKTFVIYRTEKTCFLSYRI